MDRLWSPWRMEYIRSAVAQDAEGCFLCGALAGGDDGATFILARGGSAFVILNAYPYNPGHLLVATNRHVGDLTEVTGAEIADCGSLQQRAIEALRASAAPDGFNVGLNLGRVAGAGVPGHVHWHVVPRWAGDTNFMPVLGQTKVLPELLAETYARLLPSFAEP